MKYTGNHYHTLIKYQEKENLNLKDKGNAKKSFIFDHHIVRKSQICSLNKLTSKELYLILPDASTAKPAV